jgi:hypothetical protein
LNFGDGLCVGVEIGDEVGDEVGEKVGDKIGSDDCEEIGFAEELGVEIVSVVFPVHPAMVIKNIKNRKRFMIFIFSPINKLI